MQSIIDPMLIDICREKYVFPKKVFFAFAFYHNELFEIKSRQSNCLCVEKQRIEISGVGLKRR